MADQTPSLGRGAWTARLLVLLAALAGLFAMHGLTDHGAAHPIAVASSTPMSMTHAHESSAEEPVLDRTPVFEAPDVGGHAGVGLAGMCLAVLGLAGFARWLLAGRGRALASWFHVPTLALRPVTASLDRSRDPPDLVRLQVHRC